MRFAAPLALLYGGVAVLVWVLDGTLWWPGSLAYVLGAAGFGWAVGSAVDDATRKEGP